MPARRRQTVQAVQEPEVKPLKRSTRARAIKTINTDLDSNKKETTKKVKDTKTEASNIKKRNTQLSKPASPPKNISTPEQNDQTNRLRSRSRTGKENVKQPVDNANKETTSNKKASTRPSRNTVKRVEHGSGPTDTTSSKGKENKEPVIIGARRKRKLEDPTPVRKNSLVARGKRSGSRATLQVDALKGNDSSHNVAECKRKKGQTVRKDVDNDEKVDTGQKVMSNTRKRKKSSVATSSEVLFFLYF